MEAFSPKLFTSKSLERMYNEGSNNLKRGLPMKNLKSVYVLPLHMPWISSIMEISILITQK